MYRRASINPNKTLSRKEAQRADKLNEVYGEGEEAKLIDDTYEPSLYVVVHHTILAHQSHTLGLFPRGHSNHARVRDNVYCAMSLWALALGYRYVNQASIDVN